MALGVGVGSSFSWVGVGLFFGVRVGPSFSESGLALRVGVGQGPDPKEENASSSQEGENGKARGPAKRKGR